MWLPRKETPNLWSRVKTATIAEDRLEKRRALQRHLVGIFYIQ